MNTQGDYSINITSEPHYEEQYRRLLIKKMKSHFKGAFKNQCKVEDYDVYIHTY